MREAVGDSIAVLAKLNMVDGYRGGIWIDESLEAARLFSNPTVCSTRLELTGGSSLKNPMYLFKGDAPIDEMAQAFPQPVRTGFQAARRQVPPYVPV